MRITRYDDDDRSVFPGFEANLRATGQLWEGGGFNALSRFPCPRTGHTPCPSLHVGDTMEIMTKR